MSERTISGVVPAGLYEVAQQAAEYDGTSMSALVSSALTLYLGLPGSARRAARYVLASGSAESRDALLEGCGRAIAMAGDRALTAHLAARGRAMGLQDEAVSEAAIDEEAAQAVRDARRVRRGVRADATTASGGVRR
jgi:hypothetical protein